MLKSSNESELFVNIPAPNYEDGRRHEELIKLLYSELSVEDCQKYLDPLFIKKLRVRALEGIKYIINNIAHNAITMQGRHVPFLLDKQMQEITLRSQISSANFKFFVKAQLNANDKDVNILEYAALAGIPELFHRFSQFGVESEHLQCVVDNINKIYSNVGNYAQVHDELDKMLAAMSQTSLEIVKTQVEHSKLQILINNHKCGVILHTLLMFLGIAVICVAALAIENRNEPAVGILIAGGTALCVNAVVNILNIFVNIARQDYVENQKVNREALAELASNIRNIGNFINLEINTASIFSPLQLPPQNLSLTHKPENSVKKLIFSKSNLAGLNTNSETTSQHEMHARDNKLRTFGYI
jgi:hypothetical protein